VTDAPGIGLVVQMPEKQIYASGQHRPFRFRAGLTCRCGSATPPDVIIEGRGSANQRALCHGVLAMRIEWGSLYLTVRQMATAAEGDHDRTRITHFALPKGACSKDIAPRLWQIDAMTAKGRCVESDQTRGARLSVY